MKLISNQINPHFALRDAIFSVLQVRFVTTKKQIDFLPWFGTENYRLFNAARSALETIIDAVNPPKNKKIALPAFICAVVAVPFVRRGYEIEWIDTDENGCMDLEDFRAKSDNVSLVVVPHIFGQIIDLLPFATLCKQKGIFLIEDGAHGWSFIENENSSRSPFVRGDFLVDARILSFGREKVVSCVSGGVLLWPENSSYADQFKSLKVSFPSKVWICKHLFQPFFYALAMPWWGIGGKVIPLIAQKLNLMPKAVHRAEKKGKKVLSVTTLPYSQQRVLRYQLRCFFGTIKKNKKSVLTSQRYMASVWQEALKDIFLLQDIIVPDSGFRVIVKTNQAQKIGAALLKKNIHLREWDGVPIAPFGTDLKVFGYKMGYCPRAEFFSHNYITLPTNRHMSQKDVKKIVKLIKDCIN